MIVATDHARQTHSQVTPQDADRYNARFAVRATKSKSSAMRDLMALAERP